MQKTLYTLLVAIILHSCIKTKDAVTVLDTTDKENANFNLIQKKNSDSINVLIQAEIQKYVLQLESDDKEIAKEFIFSKYLLKDSYHASKDMPLWTAEKNRKDLVEVIENAGNNGLLPEDYHLKKIKTLLSNFKQLNPSELAILDVLLTDSAILYAYHLIKGKISPEKLIPTWNFMQNDIPKYALTLLQNAINDEKISEVLHNLEPQDKEYRLLKKQLAQLNKMSENGAWETVKFTKTVRPDDAVEGLSYLRKRLIAEHYLDASTSINDTIYSVNLQEAVKKFQHANGVNEDAVIGKATLKMLNESIEKKIAKITCNLERRRWIRYPKDTAYIKVNIASFKMNFIEQNKVVYSSNVVVGQTKKQTPSFMDTLELIVLNPTWTLPYSISSKETLPKLKKDSNYLNRNNMILMDKKGNLVDGTAIDWSSFSSADFPYRVRQKSGSGNALGRVKFLFPNKHAIYLHDTPSKRLFSKDVRAFSHGCIRLQHPLQFADFLLQREDTIWNSAKIDKIIVSGRTKTIKLQHQYPIFIIYQTVAENEQGEIIYMNDIYKRDEKLYDLLAKPL